MTTFRFVGLTLAAALGASFSLAFLIQVQANDMFPTRDAALKRAKQLKCAGAFP